MAYAELFIFCLECEELLYPDKDSITCVGCCRWAHAACLRIPTEALESFESIKKFGFLWMCNQCQASRGLPKTHHTGSKEMMHADKVVVKMELEEENDVENINKQISQEKLVVEVNDFPDKTVGEPVSVEQTEQLQSLSNWTYVKKKKYVKKPANCPQCGKKFSSNCALKTHLASVHSGEKPYSCKVCGKKFALKFIMLKHVLIHSEEKTYSCNICERKFTLPTTLDSHLRTHKKSYRCSWEGCNGRFAQSEQLKQHNLKHTSEPPPFMCHICGKAFYCSRSLKKHHVKIHTDNEKPFSCSTCNKKFSFQDELNTHVSRTHSEAKTLCDICGAACADTARLKLHMLTHNEEKPFACDFCEKRFHRSFSLQEHRRVHTGEKPYSCNVCFKRFSQKHSLTTHMKNGHNV